MRGIRGGTLTIIADAGDGARQHRFKLTAAECREAASVVNGLRSGMGTRPRRIGEAESVDVWREVNGGEPPEVVGRRHGISKLQVENAVLRCENGRYGKLEP